MPKNKVTGQNRLGTQNTKIQKYKNKIKMKNKRKKWIKVEQKSFITNKNKEKKRKNNRKTKTQGFYLKRTKIGRQVGWAFHKKVCFYTIIFEFRISY